MTVRGNKRLVLVALGLVGLAVILNAVRAFLPDGHGVSDLSGCIPMLFFLVILASMWTRLSKLEAEYGLDHVEPRSPYANRILIVASVLAVVLAIIAFLVSR